MRVQERLRLISQSVLEKKRMKVAIIFSSIFSGHSNNPWQFSPCDIWWHFSVTTLHRWGDIIIFFKKLNTKNWLIVFQHFKTSQNIPKDTVMAQKNCKMSRDTLANPLSPPCDIWCRCPVPTNPRNCHIVFEWPLKTVLDWDSERDLRFCTE